MINESDCSRDFSKEMTKKYRDTHKKIRNCNEFDNSLNFAKVSLNVSLTTIRSHIQHIRQKTGVRRITELVRMALIATRSLG